MELTFRTLKIFFEFTPDDKNDIVQLKEQLDDLDIKHINKDS